MKEIEKKKGRERKREIYKSFLNVIILTRTSFASNQHYHVSQLYYVSLINITRILNTYIIKSKVTYIFVTKKNCY